MSSRLALAGIGFLPVSLIAASAFGVADLRALAPVLVPAIAIAVLVLRSNAAALRFGPVMAAGLLATALYDVWRFAFMWLGLLSVDPIPHIGRALGVEPTWAVGYLWRYCGNGTGLALAFVALGLRGVKAGVAFGLFVCSGLLFTLVVAPHGQEMLFPLTGGSVVMAVGGHVIYGAALGYLRPERDGGIGPLALLAGRVVHHRAQTAA